MLYKLSEIVIIVVLPLQVFLTIHVQLLDIPVNKMKQQFSGINQLKFRFSRLRREIYQIFSNQTNHVNIF